MFTRFLSPSITGDVMITDPPVEAGTLKDPFMSEYSLFDIAILVMSSPAEINVLDKELMLTGKDAYLWAGAIAFIVSNNPNISTLEVEKYLENCIQKNGILIRDSVLSIEKRIMNEDIGVLLVKSFLKEAGLYSDQNFLTILKLIDISVNYLESEGLIVDPFKKWIVSAYTAVILAFPVSFTSKTDLGGNTETKIDALAWSATVHKTPTDKKDIKIKIKVKELANVLLHKLIPSIVETIENSTSSDESTQQDSTFIRQLEFIISSGVNDKDVNYLYAINTNNNEAKNDAIRKGANRLITKYAIQRKYRTLLSKM